MNKQRNKTTLPQDAASQLPSKALKSGHRQPKASRQSAQQPIQDIPHSDPVESAEPIHDEVTKRAQEIYMEKGCPQGQDDQIWLQAEIELRHKKLAVLRSKLHL